MSEHILCMKNKTYMITGLVIVSIITFIIISRSRSNKNYITTKSMDKEFVNSFDFNRASEDVAYILDDTGLSVPKTPEIDIKHDYKPDFRIDWVITLTKHNSEQFNKSDINTLFDSDWRIDYPSTIYGLSTNNNRWHYANAGDSPSSFTKLQIAVDLLDLYNEEETIFDPSELERYTAELNRKIDLYTTGIRIKTYESTKCAVERAKKLVAYDNEFNQGVTIVLMGDKQFDGKITWDALNCLGLEWGDGDLFQWTNKNMDYGPDQHFIVWTTTEPGYFLPVSIESGEMNPKNLVFGLDILSSIDPLIVFDVMYRSVEYCQKRLGGKILNKDLQPFNKDKERQFIMDLLEKKESCRSTRFRLIST